MAEVETDREIGVDKPDIIGDMEKFKGHYRKLLLGMNSTLDALSLNGLP